MDENDLNLLTEKVIGCAFSVGNALGVGFLEKVYENGLAYELRKAGFKVEQQKPINVIYDGVIIGDYFADLLVNDFLLIELKTVKSFDEIHSAQCLNYQKATKLPLCLLINFGRPRVDVRRVYISANLRNISS